MEDLVIIYDMNVDLPNNVAWVDCLLVRNIRFLVDVYRQGTVTNNRVKKMYILSEYTYLIGIVASPS